MVTEATKTHREIFAYGLLAFAGLFFMVAFSLLMKDYGDAFGFTDKSAVYGSMFVAPTVAIALALAAVLVVGFGGPTKNARTLVMVALGIGALDALFGVITFLASFGAAAGFGATASAGIVGAGKVVGLLGMLAYLVLFGTSLFFLFTVFKGLPAPAPKVAAQSWGQPQQGWGQQPQQGHQPQQGQWGEPGQQQGQQAQSWGQGAGQGGQPGWGTPSYGEQPQQSWGTDPGQPPVTQPTQTQRSHPPEAAPGEPPAQQWSSGRDSAVENGNAGSDQVGAPEDDDQQPTDWWQQPPP